MAYPPPIDPVAHALFLDFDGTLVGFADDPAAVRIDPAVLTRLEALQGALGGAVAIVSGRRIADLDRFLHPWRFAAAGVHGLELRATPEAGVDHLARADRLDDLRVLLGEGVAALPGLRLEDKGTALVLHTRTAPELRPAASAMMARAVRGRGGFVVMEGDGIVEVHAAGMDKGKAAAFLMTGEAFAGRRPIYAGDDVTDEFALSYVRQAGGVSVKVGVGASIAEFRLPDVAALHRWIGAAP